MYNFHLFVESKPAVYGAINRISDSNRYLFRLPQVVCYKGGAVSYAIARMVVGNRVKYISLPNLILDKPVVKELIQSDLTSQNLKQELHKIIEGPERQNMLNEYDRLIQLLGNSGASKKVAQLIYNYIHEKK